VKITDEAIGAAVTLSDRYISGKFQPDKAIDVIDETGSRAHLMSSTRPTEFGEMDKGIEELAKKKEDAVKNQEFEKAAQMRDEIKLKKEELERKKREWEEKRAKEVKVLEAEDVAVVVSKMTNIPVFRLEEKESQKLLRMEEEVNKRVVGQNEAISVLAKAVRRNRAGLSDPKRPIGSFIFLGPTGVGKTEMARALAAFLFEDENNLIRIDMSEYMEKFAVSRLIGAPPGYVGYEEGGQLTERVRRKPYSVVLLDEIEKAHPEVFNILLQMLDDGQLTDSFGRKVDFRNTLVILTSNIGAREIKAGKSLGFQKTDEATSYDLMKQKLLEETKKMFNPELLNRLDEIIVFHALGIPEVLKIVDILLVDLARRLAERGISFTLTDGAKQFLAEKGFDANYGARPLRRSIQKYLENPLADEILKGQFAGDSEILIDKHAQEDRLSFRVVIGSGTSKGTQSKEFVV
ncbi:MAG: ATP-dependent Clp protease ATP-binding subunit, partial [candidate division Zixibacteria bacterium]|nr:ATP-dependent Clp protease ATP-binding subunit [candidate division Zixibacteria bacterium]